MGRKPCCEKVGLKKGPWTADEDKKLINFIIANGQSRWRALPKLAGLSRCGKSCRLRWTNYLRPDLKRGLLSDDEEKIVIDLHAQLGNKWSKIASQLPGRTDNEIKNIWNTHIKKKLKKMGIDPVTHEPLDQPKEEQPKTTIDPDEEAEKEPPPQPESTTDDETISALDQQNKEADQAKEDDKNVMISQSPLDFCIDDVPLIEPDEIPVPYSTSSSSISSSSCFDGSCDAFDLDFLPTFDWQSSYDYPNHVEFWADDFIGSLDMLLDDDIDGNFMDVGF